MTTALTDQLSLLTERINSVCAEATSELTLFPSGGAMFDVRRSDGRAFVLAFTPEYGFAVDELQVDDGFSVSYKFTSLDFEQAAGKLCELVSDSQFTANPELNLVVVYAHDLEAACEFYASLGLLLQPEQHGTGPRHYAAMLGEAVFEIYPKRDGEQKGNLRIGFQVASVDEIIQRLRQRHVPILTEPKESAWGRRAVVEDPDGNRVELNQKSVSVAS